MLLHYQHEVDLEDEQDDPQGKEKSLECFICHPLVQPLAGHEKQPKEASWEVCQVVVLPLDPGISSHHSYKSVDSGHHDWEQDSQVKQPVCGVDVHKHGVDVDEEHGHVEQSDYFHSVFDVKN